MQSTTPNSRPLKIDAPAMLRLWHVASLDAPTVAVVWSLAFAWVARVRLPVWVPVLVGLTTWAVYVIDRLLDARTALQKGLMHRLRERHRFHWRHRRVLLPSGCAAAGAAALIVFARMTPMALERNSVLAAATFAYFARIHSRRQPVAFKIPSFAPVRIFNPAFLTGLLFTAGCVLPAFSRSAKGLQPGFAAVAVYFGLLAWLDSYAINRWEASREIGGKLVSSRAGLLAAAGLICGLLFAVVDVRVAALLAAGAASALLLAVLDLKRDRLTAVALRTAADLVLLTPLVLLVFDFVRGG